MVNNSDIYTPLSLLYCGLDETLNLDSARQSPIEAQRSERRSPAQSGQGEKEDRFGEVAASPNSKFHPGPSIDWEKQWADFAPGFDGTFAHIPLANGSHLKLKPGPGFGDASHPTTQLMLEQLAQIVPGKRVLDIGCGSGILSIASCLLGAKYVYGIDIEEDAISHSWENSRLNPGSKKMYFATSLADSLQKSVVLMNMISSEQKEAWRSLALPSSLVSQILVSGVLQEERSSYLEYVEKEWGFQLKKEWQKEGWASFLFELDR